MGVAEILSFITIVLKFAMIMWEKLQKTPSEERRASLAEFDQALAQSKEHKDLRELSKWLGKRT